MSEQPTFALEFWDAHGDLIVAHFPPDGEAEAIVAENTSSETLLEMKGKSVAQVSVLTDSETGMYRRIGEIHSHDTTIDELVIEFLQSPMQAYDQFTEIMMARDVLAGDEARKRVLN